MRREKTLRKKSTDVIEEGSKETIEKSFSVYQCTKEHHQRKSQKKQVLPEGEDPTFFLEKEAFLMKKARK
jgi:hypothetical protein